MDHLSELRRAVNILKDEVDGSAVDIELLDYLVGRVSVAMTGLRRSRGLSRPSGRPSAAVLQRLAAHYLGQPGSTRTKVAKLLNVSRTTLNSLVPPKPKKDNLSFLPVTPVVPVEIKDLIDRLREHRRWEEWADNIYREHGVTAPKFIASAWADVGSKVTLDKFESMFVEDLDKLDEE